MLSTQAHAGAGHADTPTLIFNVCRTNDYRLLVEHFEDIKPLQNYFLEALFTTPTFRAFLATGHSPWYLCYSAIMHTRYLPDVNAQFTAFKKIFRKIIADHPRLFNFDEEELKTSSDLSIIELLTFLNLVQCEKINSAIILLQKELARRMLMTPPLDPFATVFTPAFPMPDTLPRDFTRLGAFDFIPTDEMYAPCRQQYFFYAKNYLYLFIQIGFVNQLGTLLEIIFSTASFASAFDINTIKHSTDLAPMNTCEFAYTHYLKHAHEEVNDMYFAQLNLLLAHGAIPANAQLLKDLLLLFFSKKQDSPGFHQLLELLFDESKRPPAPTDSFYPTLILELNAQAQRIYESLASFKDYFVDPAELYDLHSFVTHLSRYAVWAPEPVTAVHILADFNDYVATQKQSKVLFSEESDHEEDAELLAEIALGNLSAAVILFKKHDLAKELNFIEECMALDVTAYTSVAEFNTLEQRAINRLKKNPWLANEEHATGLHPLHLAAHYGLPKLTQALLSNPATEYPRLRISETSHSMTRYTCFAIACAAGHHEVAKMIFERYCLLTVGPQIESELLCVAYEDQRVLGLNNYRRLHSPMYITYRELKDTADFHKVRSVCLYTDKGAVNSEPTKISNYLYLRESFIASFIAHFKAEDIPKKVSNSEYAEILYLLKALDCADYVTFKAGSTLNNLIAGILLAAEDPLLEILEDFSWETATLLTLNNPLRDELIRTICTHPKKTQMVLLHKIMRYFFDEENTVTQLQKIYNDTHAIDYLLSTHQENHPDFVMEDFLEKLTLLLTYKVYLSPETRLQLLLIDATSHHSIEQVKYFWDLAPHTLVITEQHLDFLFARKAYKAIAFLLAQGVRTTAKRYQECMLDCIDYDDEVSFRYVCPLLLSHAELQARCVELKAKKCLSALLEIGDTTKGFKKISVASLPEGTCYEFNRLLPADSSFRTPAFQERLESFLVAHPATSTHIMDSPEKPKKLKFAIPAGLRETFLLIAQEYANNHTKKTDADSIVTTLSSTFNDALKQWNKAHKTEKQIELSQTLALQKTVVTQALEIRAKAIAARAVVVSTAKTKKNKAPKNAVVAVAAPPVGAGAGAGAAEDKSTSLLKTSILKTTTAPFFAPPTSSATAVETYELVAAPTHASTIETICALLPTTQTAAVVAIAQASEPTAPFTLSDRMPHEPSSVVIAEAAPPLVSASTTSRAPTATMITQTPLPPTVFSAAPFFPPARSASILRSPHQRPLPGGPLDFIIHDAALEVVLECCVERHENSFFAHPYGTAPGLTFSGAFLTPIQIEPTSFPMILGERMVLRFAKEKGSQYLYIHGYEPEGMGFYARALTPIILINGDTYLPPTLGTFRC